MFPVVVVLILLITSGNCIKKSENSCYNSYNNCNLGIDGMINVHIVPHTHDDVGWLKTVDQYYYGSNTSQQRAGVQYILDSVVDELIRDASKRFVYVEIAFFWRWWNEQDDNVKQSVRKLVSEGRLEFIIGGWCMNDEASTYYQDIIDQQTLGFEFILNEFGECARPKVAWQTDPFGHSREQASLFAQFGFDGLFLGRIDYQDNEYRDLQLSREMVWKASANLGYKGTIFTGVLPNISSPPKQFCFDTHRFYCDDDPIMDNPKLEDYNVDYKVDLFINYTLQERNRYKTNNLIMTMGTDFEYSNARMWFKNLDKLIYYVNQRQINGSNINIFYSTTSCYLYSLYKSNITWPEKNDDFFPYAHRPNSFWTGYFTSRITFKGYVRRINNYLQSIRHLSVFSNLKDVQTQNALDTLTRAMGIAQHHDAVSGTERQHVANDYAKRLAKGTNMCIDIIKNSYTNMIQKKVKSSTLPKLEFYICPLMNISECQQIEFVKNISIIVYNPLGQNQSYWIRVPVTNNNYIVYDLDTFNIIESEFVEISPETKRIPERNSSANYEVLFQVNLPGLGFKTFGLFESKKHKKSLIKPANKKLNSLENQKLQILFDSNGNLKTINNLDSSITSNIQQNFCYYKSMTGNNSIPELQSSGAYIFRPNGDPICLTVKEFYFTQGKQFSEIHQIFNSFISQTIRLYENANYLEFNWQVGPIDVSDGIGKEIIVKFATDLDTNSLFYTDSNGREILKRKRDYRPSWPNFNQTEPVAGNYYPINSRIFIRDETNERQLTLVTDRTHGGSSINDGEIELMLHRRILNDDSLGLNEPLNETGSDGLGLIAKGNFYLFLNSTSNSARLHREMSHKINTQPLVTFSLIKNESDIELIRQLSQINVLNGSLPPNVHLLTLMHEFKNEETNTLIVRFEHFYELYEDIILSQPVTFDLRYLLSGTFNLLSIQELGLGANINVDDLSQRLKFNSKQNLKQIYSISENFQVTLNPMEIKTFRVWYEIN